MGTLKKVMAVTLFTPNWCEFVTRACCSPTIESPADWNHPVSGTRKFGYIQNSDGSYTFYTRGVDRVTEASDISMADRMNWSHPFEGADALWNKFKENLYKYVDNHSGNAQLPQERTTKFIVLIGIK